MASLAVRPGFDWGRVVWGKPNEPRSEFCSLCFAGIADDDVPLILTKDDGHVAQFCDKCVERWWTTASP